MHYIFRVMASFCLLFTQSDAFAMTDSILKKDKVSVRVISTDFVLPGKIHLLQQIAERNQITLQGLYIEDITSQTIDGLSGTDLVILDTPRGGDRARAMEALQPALQTTTMPWIAVGGGRPQSGNLNESISRSLIAYYAAGGNDNFQHMMEFIRAWSIGESTASVAQPVPLPASGIYHPEAQKQFTRWSDYLDWGTQKPQPRWDKKAPVLAVAMSSSHMSNADTAVYDAIIAAVEQAGGVPLIFWHDRSQENTLSNLVSPAEPIMLVNTTHMMGEELKQELSQLNIPLVTGLNYRSGSVNQWRESVQGISAGSAAALMVIPEIWGMSDPLVLSALEDGTPQPIPEQIDLLVQRFMAQAALRHTPVEQQRLALLFWNSPSGEKNLSASNLNVPRSLENIIQTLHNAGYAVTPRTEEELITTAQRLLSAYYHPEKLDTLLEDDLAVTLSVGKYQDWLDYLPVSVRQQLQQSWGKPENHWSVRNLNGAPHFVIPMARLKQFVFLPQPPRADRMGESTHDLLQPPGHFYLATYLYLRKEFSANALIHLGTHGTQEWTPGKDRGLWAYDYPNLAVGNIPVFYPYIQDNIGEAMQAKRRGRAITISHQTPPFVPSGFYGELLDIHDLMHQYLQLETGAIRDATLANMMEMVKEYNLNTDLGWADEDLLKRSDEFVAVLHDHLHQLAQATTPIGLHSFGEPSATEYRTATVMQQLGSEYYQALQLDTKEVFADSFDELFEAPAYTYLQTYLNGDKQPEQAESPELQAMVQQAMQSEATLSDPQELEALLAGLQGQLVKPGSGGDPVRNPNTTSGTNLYAIDPEKIPTAEAYQAAEATFDQLIEDYRSNHNGEWPDKLAFSFWSSETIRTMGLSEAQVMHALGVKPVWGPGGRITHLDIIPAEELGRPRVDTLIQITSVYRDQFDGIMKKLATVIEDLAQQNEANNPIAVNTQRITASLQQQGLSADAAARFASARLFSNPPGSYGSGVTDVAMNSTEWEDDQVLADTFINSQSHVYSHHDWGKPVQKLGLLQAQLQGVDAVMLSRSSNLHGLLSTDHPFEYLGGLSAAVKSVTGENPDLYISNARNREANIASASGFLSDELRTRYQNPQWIKGMQAEGYAGTVNMLKVVNNMFGWQVMDPNMVRDDQWQAMHETYVMDQRDLGLNQWFETHNATAQAQLIERMMEAIRKGYWDAPETTRQQMVERWDTLVNKLNASSGAKKTVDFIEQQAAGFGINLTSSDSDSTSSSNEVQPVQGQVLEQVQASEEKPLDDWSLWFIWLMLTLSFVAGGVRTYVGLYRQAMALTNEQNQLQPLQQAA